MANESTTTKDMKTRSTLLAIATGISLAAFSLQAQVTYFGNGNTGFGGPLGTGSLTLNDDGTTVFATFTRGAGDHNDAVVLYIDSALGGIGNTSQLTDNADGLRTAISGFSDPGRTTVNFADGFAADYAIAFDSSFGGLWALQENASHTFITSVDFSGGGNQMADYTFSFNVADIGLAPNAGDSFSFVATYISTSGFRSNEAIGDSDAGGSNLGFDGTLTFTGFMSYATVPEPSTYALLGLAGGVLLFFRRFQKKS